jgi:hypothetical protein
MNSQCFCDFHELENLPKNETFFVIFLFLEALVHKKDVLPLYSENFRMLAWMLTWECFSYSYLNSFQWLVRCSMRINTKFCSIIIIIWIWKETGTDMLVKVRACDWWAGLFGPLIQTFHLYRRRLAVFSFITADICVNRERTISWNRSPH